MADSAIPPIVGSVVGGWVAAFNTVISLINGRFASRPYVWANAAARTAQTGMTIGEYGYQTDTQITYRAISATTTQAWSSPWITATPTLTNITLGTGGVAQFRYKYGGDILFFELYVLLGVGGVLTGAPASTLAVNSRALDHPNEQLQVGGSYYDTSAGSVYPVQMRFNGSAVNSVVLQNPTVAVNATSPFTWAATDVISIKGSYRPA